MQSVNLLERTDIQRPGQAGVRQLILALVLVIAVLGTVGMLERTSLANVRTELARTQAQAERLRSEQAALVAPNAQWLARIDTDEREVQAVESVAQQLQSGNLGSTHSFAEQLRAFGRATTSGVWITGITLDNATEAITLDGKAIDASRVPVLLQSLQADPHFGGTRLASIELSAGDADGTGKARAILFHIVTPAAEAAGTGVPAAATLAALPAGNGPVAQAGSR